MSSDQATTTGRPAPPAAGRPSALAVEVPEAEPLVAGVRAARDPGAAEGMPAHVTVLYPFLDPADLDAGLPRLRTLLSGVHGFDVAFTRVDHVPGVLWLHPEPDAPFRALTATLAAAYPQHPPYRGRYADPQPHLSIARRLRPEHVASALAEVRSAVDPGLPLRCAVRAVTLFVRDDAGQWRRREVLPLLPPARV
jgi:hypothetical protein